MLWKSMALDKMSAKGKWHRWFAWHPVNVGGTNWCWLEWVERSVEYVSAYDGTYAFPKYRHPEIPF